MPTLRELEAKFLHRNPDGSSQLDEVLEGADGIIFECPLCLKNNGSSNVGVHSVICWFVGRVPDDLSPGPGRWTPEGTGLDDLTFVPGDPPRAVSVFLNSKDGDGEPTGCQWHGHLRAGVAE